MSNNNSDGCGQVMTIAIGIFVGLCLFCVIG